MTTVNQYKKLSLDFKHKYDRIVNNKDEIVCEDECTWTDKEIHIYADYVINTMKALDTGASFDATNTFEVQHNIFVYHHDKIRAVWNTYVDALTEFPSNKGFVSYLIASIYNGQSTDLYFKYLKKAYVSGHIQAARSLAWHYVYVVCRGYSRGYDIQKYVTKEFALECANYVLANGSADEQYEIVGGMIKYLDKEAYHREIKKIIYADNSIPEADKKKTLKQAMESRKMEIESRW